MPTPEQSRPIPERGNTAAPQETIPVNPEAHTQALQIFKAELAAASSAPVVAQEISAYAQKHGVTLPGEVQSKIESAQTEHTRRLLAIRLKGNEEEYLVNHKVVMELEERYNSDETHPKNVLKAVEAYAAKVGASNELPEQFEGTLFSNETMELLAADVETRIGAYFANKETGRVNPKKRESLIGQTRRYMELLHQAQTEGALPAELALADVAKMVRENIDKLAYQDRVAAENLLGDHGIRHLVDHNIVVSEKIFDQLAGKGQAVSAIDRLMAHQIMIDHDIGYATSVVRDPINEHGIKGQDAGHNLLAAKFIAERIADGNDHLNKIFGSKELEQIHAGILEHDSSKLEFTVGDNSPEARRKNLESAIHLADNTHAFEDKLPELLYGVPETLKYMRLMKIAGETGDTAKVEEIKSKLASFIESQSDFSLDDKAALTMAIKGLSSESYRFTVPRICGNKPEFAIDENGRVEITVQESAIHREAMAVFDQDSLKQLTKFIKDLGGPAHLGLDDDPIETENIVFKLATGESGSQDHHNDYQERIAQLISEESFRTLLDADMQLSEEASRLEQELAADPATTQNIQPQLVEIRSKRTALLDSYLSTQ